MQSRRRWLRSRRPVDGKRLLLALSALAAATAPLAARPAAHVPRTQVERGLEFAQAHCAACHAVVRDHFSPNPQAPAWEDVVAKEGLTHETLTYWLRHSHNFPEIMNFEIADDQVDALAAYMLTLRDRPAARRR